MALRIKYGPAVLRPSLLIGEPGLDTDQNAERMWIGSQDGNLEVLLKRNSVSIPIEDDPVILLNCEDGIVYSVTIEGNRMLGAPTGTPFDGQIFELRVRQGTGGSHTLAYNSIYRFGIDVPSPTLSLLAGSTDYLLFQYNSTDSMWDCLSVAQGY